MARLLSHGDQGKIFFPPFGITTTGETALIALLLVFKSFAISGLYLCIADGLSFNQSDASMTLFFGVDCADGDIRKGYCYLLACKESTERC